MPAGLRILRHLDIVFLVCALPIFIGADLPLLGWAGGTFAYVSQRLIGVLLSRSAAQTDDMAGFLGVMVGGTIARGFFVALSIFGVGLIKDEAGAAAGFLFLAAFTIYFTMALAMRPYQDPKGGSK
jgi:hypothetical protein